MEFKINFHQMYGGCNNGHLLAITRDGHTTRLGSRDLHCVKQCNDFCSWEEVEGDAIVAFGNAHGEVAVIAYYRYDIGGRASYPSVVYGEGSAVEGFVEGETPAEFAAGNLDEYKVPAGSAGSDGAFGVKVTSTSRPHDVECFYYKDTPRARALARANFRNLLAAGWAQWIALD